ncbi:MAG TPA: DUF4388 domain-containing protein [Kofleriaceae bacterium]|nr:DUF4388 domain-containing protein [Kofleriaceae bacterium]
MAEPPVTPCILIVADADRVPELIGALSEPLPTAVVSRVEVVTTAGGDDSIDVFAARRPHVVVATASLEAGDTAALVDALRELAPAGQAGFVIVGDLKGPIRTALDASELRPDRFVTRPLAPRTLRFAVASVLEQVIKVRLPTVPLSSGTSPGTDPGVARANAAAPVPTSTQSGAPTTAVTTEVSDATRAAQRARWEALADSLVDGDDIEDEVVEALDEPAAGSDAGVDASLDEPAPLPPPMIIRPRGRASDQIAAVAGAQPWQPGTTSQLEPWIPPEPPAREPTLIIREPDLVPPARQSEGSVPDYQLPRTRTIETGLGTPPNVPLVARTATDDVIEPPRARTRTSDPPVSRTKTGDDEVDMAERPQPGAAWSQPVPIAALSDAPDAADPGDGEATTESRAKLELDAALEDVDHVDADAMAAIDAIDGEGGVDRASYPGFDPFEGPGDRKRRRLPSEGRLEVLDDLPDPVPEPPASVGDGRDFARQLRAKMSMMAQRLFQGGDAGAVPAPADLAPRHDHHTEIDLSSLGEDLPLGGGVTEIEARAAQRPSDVRDLTTSPGSWDTQVRERGLPDQGEIVRGVSDAAMLLARMFVQGATGRIGFRRDGIEKTVYFDQGRPVFAASNEPGDRMGELLVREGKITAAQYDRCQSVVTESGRRIGEILVDFGYLKRRELLPAVRRHVEDIVYSLFGWDRGHYRITIEDKPCSERIRLSRHPAALVLEGIRRKHDRASLERMIGPPSTVIEVSDRERLGGIINTGDLASEERAALAAIDGQSDLVQVARTAGVDVADVLPLAWGLCVLGLAVARRTDTEIPDESTALVGETDLAIDRERVRARWQLVTEADYFALLGVRRDATAFEIRRAYQSARRDFASDGFPADLRRELAQELDDIANVLDEAFRVLRDDRLRSTYLANLIE